MPQPKTLMVIGAPDGCAMWRGVQPVEALNSRGFPCAWRPRAAPDIDKQTDVADIVILERIYWQPNCLDDMEHWFRVIHNTHHRRLVVYETDDDAISINAQEHIRLFHDDWNDVDVDLHRDAAIAAMQRCDAMTTTTEPLAELLRDMIGVPVYVLPNAIRWGKWRASWESVKPTDIPKDKLVIGWAGGWRVKDDLAPMIEAWKLIAAAHEDVHFVIAGTVHPEYLNALPADRLTYREWVEVNKYPHQYAGFNIACCPLADMPFNYKKSPCKALEAGAAECAVVASPIVYNEVIDHGRNGLIANTTNEWIDALDRLIADKKYRRQLARRWSERVETRYNLDKNCWQWANAWEKIMQAGPRYTSSNMVPTTLAG